ncbi:MAG: hypothetical protein AAF242_19195, partial [Bacteroidota bacterium]
MVYSVEGKVRYLADDNPETKPKKVVPGMKLSEEGTIIIREDGKVGIYFDELMGTVAKNGRHAVTAILDDPDLLEETDLAAIFGKNLEKAAHPYYAGVKVSRAGFAAAGGPKKPPPPPPPPNNKGRHGHGDKAYKIIRVSPVGGKVSGDTLSFRWRLRDSVKVSNKLTLTVQSKEGEIMGTVPAKKIARTVPAKRFKLSEGSTYQWFVSSTEVDSIRSGPVEFQYVSHDEVNAIMLDLSNEKAYQSSTASAKLLMEASLLELKGFYMEAYDRLRTAIKTDKKNKLARNLHKAYLFKHDIVK